MKKTLSTIMALAVSAAASAYDYPYLTFLTADGTVQSLAVEQLTLTVVDGRIVAQNAETSATFALAELSRMYFTTEPTGIAEIAATPSGSGIEVFSAAGTLVGRFPSAAQVQDALPRGIYVIKTNGLTEKIVIR